MTASHDQFAWLDHVQNDESELIDQAASDLALEVSVILDHAFRARVGVSQQDLADKLGVTAGRVSQVLNGDGNLHVATVGRYLRALGYELGLRPKSVVTDAPELERDSRAATNIHVYRTRFADSAGVYEGFQIVTAESEVPPLPMEKPRPVSTSKISAKSGAYYSAQKPAFHTEEAAVTERSYA